MTDPAPKLSLIGKLCRIMAAVDHIEKKGRNKEQGYDFVRESDVKAELRSLFAKENVWPSPDVEDASYVEFPTKSGGVMHFCRLKVRITFEDGDSGETRSCRVMGEAMDSGDKASNKALTAAVKVALLQSMLIPTGDDTENDPKPEKHAARPQATAPASAPASAMDPRVAAKWVAAFAAAGVPVAALETRVGLKVGQFTVAEERSLGAFLKEARAKAKPKTPDELAQDAVKAQAEAAFASGEKSLASPVAKPSTVEANATFKALAERIAAAPSEADALLIQA